MNVNVILVINQSERILCSLFTGVFFGMRVWLKKKKKNQWEQKKKKKTAIKKERKEYVSLWIIEYLVEASRSFDWERVCVVQCTVHGKIHSKIIIKIFFIYVSFSSYFDSLSKKDLCCFLLLFNHCKIQCYIKLKIRCRLNTESKIIMKRTRNSLKYIQTKKFFTITTIHGNSKKPKFSFLLYVVVSFSLFLFFSFFFIDTKVNIC